MLIIKNRLIHKSNKINTYETDFFKVFWTGFIFCKDKENGLESVNHIAELLEQKKIEQITPEIFGNYFICIYDKNKKHFVCFIDNSGIFKAYFDKNSISTSIFEIIKEKNYSINSLKKESCVELINMGFLYLNKTLIKEIECLSSKFIYSFNKNNEITKTDKTENTINCGKSVSLEESFSILSKSIKNEKIEIDITGGSDTRLVTTVPVFPS